MKDNQLYSIAEASKEFGLSVHTLRYYDKEGLIPSLKKTPSGIRQFTKEDFMWLELVTCLKETGMPIKEIKTYFEYCKMGDETIEIRLDMLLLQKKRILEKLALFKKHEEKVDYKIWYYQTAKDAGTLEVHKKNS